jgi:hypothetical protein
MEKQDRPAKCTTRRRRGHAAKFNLDKKVNNKANDAN